MVPASGTGGSSAAPRRAARGAPVCDGSSCGLRHSTKQARPASVPATANIVGAAVDGGADGEPGDAATDSTAEFGSLGPLGIWLRALLPN